MYFNSIDYLLFLPLVLLLYFLTPPRVRWLVLLVASYSFYGWWNPHYTVLLATSTLVDFFAALQMGKLTSRRQRRPYLLASLTINLALLFLFKYLYFFVDTVGSTLASVGIAAPQPAFDLLLPIGISFYTFQTIGYSIDVYRGRIAPERNLGTFALYVSFFPQLVAGPIERARNLLPQLRRSAPFDLEAAAEGLTRITWGFFKKLLIADRLAIYVDYVYGNPAAQSGTTVAVATAFFYFQLYCDFSGYTDIAIGTARIFGIRLMENFSRPYVARSIAEGWTRWHISLSTWFRDYVYVPLARRLTTRSSLPHVARAVALIVVFVLIGAWHGANWTFVIFGLLHAIYIICGRATSRARELVWERALHFAPVGAGMLRPAVQILITFQLALISMIFFRANDFSDALLLVQSLLQWSGSGLGGVMVPPMNRYDFALAVAGILLMLVVEWVESRRSLWQVISEWPAWLRWASAYAAFLLILMLREAGQREFVYFQF